MDQSLDNIRNVILCEDIRTELGSKLSLIGVFSGAVVVAEFPATLILAAYLQYEPNTNETGRVAVEFKLFQGENEIAKGKMEAELLPDNPVNFIIPRAFVTFEKETTFSIRVSFEGGQEKEILRKTIIKGQFS